MVVTLNECGNARRIGDKFRRIFHLDDLAICVLQAYCTVYHITEVAVVAACAGGFQDIPPNFFGFGHDFWLVLLTARE